MVDIGSGGWCSGHRRATPETAAQRRTCAGSGAGCRRTGARRGPEHATRGCASGASGGPTHVECPGPRGPMRGRSAAGGRAGVHQKGRGLSGGPKSGWAGGWRRSPKRLGGGYCRLQMPLKVVSAPSPPQKPPTLTVCGRVTRIAAGPVGLCPCGCLPQPAPPICPHAVCHASGPPSPHAPAPPPHRPHVTQIEAVRSPGDLHEQERRAAQ